MKAINKLYLAIYDTSFIKVANHTHTHTHVCVPKENENQLIVKKKRNVSLNLNKINNNQFNHKNTIKRVL